MAGERTERDDALWGMSFIREGIIVFGADRRVLYVDDAVFRMLGLPPSAETEAGGAVLSRIQVSGALPVERVLQTAAEEGIWRGEAAGLHRDDHPIHLELAAHRLSGTDAGEPGILLLIRNLTRERLMEQRVLESHQLELVDKLCRGIGHELKNIVTIITAYASLLEMKLADEETVDAVHKVAETASRITGLTQRLSAVSRRARPEFEKIELGGVIGEVKGLLLKAMPAHATLVLPEPGPFPVVFVDSGALIRSILHLALNGCEAMPDGGHLTLSVDVDEVSEEDVARHPAKSPGRYAVISVADTGTGMSADTRARLFEPFFTTKENGTGLGLCSVKRAIESMNGWLGIYSEEGKGSCCRLYVPVADARTPGPAPDVADGVGTAPPPSTVLVVDDDESVARTARAILERAGYRVAVAGDAAAAIARLSREPRAVHAVLLDVVLPQVNGGELYRQLRAIRADLPIVVASGFPQAAVDRIMGVPARPCIPKPYTRKSLLDAVRGILGREEA